MSSNDEIIVDEEEVNETGVETNEEEQFDEEEDEVQPQLRRSQRVTIKPSYLDDYIILAEVECEHLLMIINDEPWDFNEAKELKV